MATVKLKLENVAVHPAERFPNALPILLEQIDRVERMIQMLLAMTRPFHLQAETVDIQSWLDRSFPSADTLSASRRVRLKTSVLKKTWSFDAFHLGRAVENLLHNAIAFAPEGSTVFTEVREESERLVIEVRDQGQGLSTADRENLFQPFASNRVDGTGLGLILAKEIVEAHGGTIAEVGNENGACFRMEIPCLKS
jgi:signal transduction histidine kinase